MAEGPPPGGDRNRGPETFIIQTVLTLLAFVAVLFRFLARALGGTSFGSDDWTMLLAMVSFSTRQKLREHFSRPMLICIGISGTQLEYRGCVSGSRLRETHFLPQAASDHSDCSARVHV